MSSITSTIAIVGNPNAGKSVLFNRLTGLKQKVANYPGVTVEKLYGKFKFSHKEIEIIDLPGIYSLNNKSEDARIASEVLTDSKYDIKNIIVLADSTNLQRSLVLALQIRDLGKSTVLALNMQDELVARGGDIDKEKLSKAMGIPVFSISATRGWGLNKLIVHLKENEVIAIPAPEIIGKKLEEYSLEARVLADQVILKKIKSHKLTDKLDAIFLHRIFGPILFLLLFALIFQSIFSWATPLMDGIENGFGFLSQWVSTGLPDGLLKNFITEGLIAGVGSILVFLPQIIILFTYIGFMEYSGYMSRASFVMDRLMALIGLQGKSFLPLLSSYACAVPGIMATRTLESKRERLITIFIAPFMTCSARLPVYILFITAFIPNISYLGGVIGLRMFVLSGLYFAGAVAAAVTAVVLKKIMGFSETLPFVQEIPPYRFPTIGTMLTYVWKRAFVFLKKVGKVILGVTILLWVCSSFPYDDVSQYGAEASYAGKIGKFIEPVIAPIGFDWKIGVGLITSLAAREVIVSTLATLYQVDNENDVELSQALLESMNIAQALSVLIFFAFAMQCFSTLAVVRKETGSWKQPVIMFVYMTVLAYVSSFVVYRVAIQYLG